MPTRQARLAAVMLWDHRTRCATFLDHNLPPDEANQMVDKLRADKLPAYTIQQGTEHSADEADGCDKCQRLLFRELRKIVKQAA